MSVGIITGSGTHALPGFADPEPELVRTPFGEATVARGRCGGADALHVSRHGERHVRLSNQLNQRAYIWALQQLGASAVIGCTACGAGDDTREPGSRVAFDDRHFRSNRV